MARLNRADREEVLRESGEALATVEGPITSQVKGLREEKGLTQSALAGHAGITGSYLSQIENRVRPLTPRVALKLSGPLGLTGDELLAMETVAGLRRDAREGTLDLEVVSSALKALGSDDAADEAKWLLMGVLGEYLAHQDNGGTSTPPRRAGGGPRRGGGTPGGSGRTNPMRLRVPVIRRVPARSRPQSLSASPGGTSLAGARGS